MKTVLSRVTHADVVSDPFPHIVIENAIDEELCEQLINEFPRMESLSKGKDLGSNKRVDYTTKDTREDPNIAKVWKEFIDANVSPEFWHQMVEIFGVHLVSMYPDFVSGKPLQSLNPGVRYIDSYDTHDVLLDAHISANTPVTKSSPPVRVAHVDDPRKVFAGLFYLRSHDDDSTGGELELYRFSRDDFRFYDQHIDYKYVEQVKTVPYKRNTLVLFLNSINSLHGVTVRNPTMHPRIFMNIVGEVEKPLFDIKSRQENKWRKRIRHHFGI